MVGKNGEIEAEDTYDESPGNEQTLVNAKKDKAQCG